MELGEHAITHCKPHLDAVIDGRDAGGITKAACWNGGGGYHFYTLAPNIINTEKYGFPIISPKCDANMLAAAMAKHENYTYSPHPDCEWK